MQHTYYIGEIAKITRTAPTTIRFYERKGIIPRPRRTSSGYRVYSDLHIRALLIVTGLKAIGISSADLAECLGKKMLKLGDSSPHLARSLYRKLDKTIHTRLKNLTFTLNSLRNASGPGAMSAKKNKNNILFDHFVPLKYHP